MKSLDLTRSPFIKDIQKGFLEEGCYLLKMIHMNVGQSSKPFLRLLISDKTGHLPAVYFGSKKELVDLQKKIKEGDIVKISGVMEEYNEILQIKIIKIKKEENRDWELSRFFKRTPHDRRNLYRDLRKITDKIKNKDIKDVIGYFFKDKNFMKLFLEAPASRFIHHAYIGGLLEHTLHVLQLAESYGNIFVQADKDLLLAGAFLHDIGKVDEYKFLLTEIDYSSEAKLKGHTLLGYDRLKKAFEKIKIDEKIKLKLEHIVLSHQGRKNWGAVIEPKFLEAYLIHAADSTDASQFIFSEVKRENAPADLQKRYWSDYISYLGREIYLG